MKPSRLHVVGAAMVDGERCFVAQRGPQMSLAGLWEFPGGKVEPRESPGSALVREVQEELGLTIDVGPWIGRGESRMGVREIALDVFYATIVGGDLSLREHADARWIRADEIDTLDWAEADRPILPVLRRVLRRGLCDKPLSRPVPIVSVDWSKDKRKRALYAALPQEDGWVIDRPPPPRSGWSLTATLEVATRLAEPFDGAALIAIDAVVGLPTGYGLLTGNAGFLETLDWLYKDRASGVSIQDPGQWSPSSPFFRVNLGQGGLNRYIERAGGPAVLYRMCERVTGGNPVFATSGIPGSVGSGSLALWHEVLAARRGSGPEFLLWPFEVELAEIAGKGTLCLAESYPRACYAIALAESLPTPPLRLAKTDAVERKHRIEQLRRAPWLRERGVQLGGLDWAVAGEDDFDALVQAAALVRMVDAQVPLSSHLTDPSWEGGILGTGGLLLHAPRVSQKRSRPRK